MGFFDTLGKKKATEAYNVTTKRQVNLQKKQN